MRGGSKDESHIVILKAKRRSDKALELQLVGRLDVAPLVVRWDVVLRVQLNKPNTPSTAPGTTSILVVLGTEWIKDICFAFLSCSFPSIPHCQLRLELLIKRHGLVRAHRRMLFQHLFAGQGRQGLEVEALVSLESLLLIQVLEVRRDVSVGLSSCPQYHILESCRQHVGGSRDDVGSEGWSVRSRHYFLMHD